MTATTYSQLLVEQNLFCTDPIGPSKQRFALVYRRFYTHNMVGHSDKEFEQIVLAGDLDTPKAALSYSREYLAFAVAIEIERSKVESYLQRRNSNELSFDDMFTAQELEAFGELVRLTVAELKNDLLPFLEMCVVAAISGAVWNAMLKLTRELSQHDEQRRRAAIRRRINADTAALARTLKRRLGFAHGGDRVSAVKCAEMPELSRITRETLFDFKKVEEANKSGTADQHLRRIVPDRPEWRRDLHTLIRKRATAEQLATQYAVFKISAAAGRKETLLSRKTLNEYYRSALRVAAALET